MCVRNLYMAIVLLLVIDTFIPVEYYHHVHHTTVVSVGVVLADVHNGTNHNNPSTVTTKTKKKKTMTNNLKAGVRQDDSTSSNNTTTTIGSNHTSNYAVIVSASRYWFNYRHNANALAIYQLLKSNGYTDDNIILMLADDYITNSRNPAKNGIYIEPNVVLQTKSKTHYPIPNKYQTNQHQQQKQKQQQQQQSWKESIYDPIHTEIDYRGDDVTVENFVNVLIGNHNNNNNNNNNNNGVKMPVLETDHTSNILIYVTGHGGNEFFKFQDIEEILAEQISSAIHTMHQRNMYNELLVIADTCQAFTLGTKIKSPNVIMIGSSLQDQSSYAHHNDPYIGLSIIEKYTYHLLQYIYKNDRLLQNSIYTDMIEPYTYQQQRATIGYSDTNSTRKVFNIHMEDFFRSRQNTINYYPDTKTTIQGNKQYKQKTVQDPINIKSVRLLTRNVYQSIVSYPFHIVGTTTNTCSNCKPIMETKDDDICKDDHHSTDGSKHGTNTNCNNNNNNNNKNNMNKDCNQSSIDNEKQQCLASASTTTITPSQQDDSYQSNVNNSHHHYHHRDSNNNTTTTTTRSSRRRIKTIPFNPNDTLFLILVGCIFSTTLLSW